MALDNAQFISELSITDPPGSDEVSEGDDQIRTVKRATQQSFPNVDAQVTLTAAQLNDVALKSVANVFPLAQIMPGIDADTDFTLRVAGGVAAENAIIARANGDVELYSNNIKRLIVKATSQVDILSDGNLDTESRHIIFAHQDGTARGQVGYNGSNVFALFNQIDGANVQIQADNTTLGQQIILDGDPEGITTLRGFTDVVLEVNTNEKAINAVANGAVELFHNNIQRLSTAAAGVVELRSDGDTDTENRLINFLHQNGTLRGLVGHNSGVNLDLDNRIDGGNVRLLARDTGAVARTILEGDPDGVTILRAATSVQLQVNNGANGINVNSGSTVDLYHNATFMVTTDTSGNGGLLVNNTLTGTGFERVLTTSDIQAKVFGGNVDSTGSANALPPGWTSSRTSLGLYVVTHNLGLAAAVDLAVTATLQVNFTLGPSVQVSPIGVNSFSVNTRNNDILFDTDFMFTAVLVPTIP